MPRKRRRTAWTAAAEASSFTFMPSDTEMTLLSSGVFRISRVEKTSNPSQSTSEDIAEFPPAMNAVCRPLQHNYAMAQQPDNTEDVEDAAVLSFGSEAISPTNERPRLESSDPIRDSPPCRPKPNHGTQSQRSLPVAPSAFVARSLLTAMDQAGSTPDKGNLSCASKRSEEASCTPLMITTSEIRRAQKCLGMSPDTPGSSGLRFIDPETERELRAVQNSTEKLNLDVHDASPASVTSPHHEGAESTRLKRESTLGQYGRMDLCSQGRFVPGKTDSSPAWTRRRLSNMSTVTPIPLNLYSPAPPKASEKPVEDQTTSGKSAKLSSHNVDVSHKDGSPVASLAWRHDDKKVPGNEDRLTSNETVHHDSGEEHVHCPSSPGRERDPFHGYTQMTAKHSARGANVDNFPSLFTTGSGRTKLIPPLSTTGPEKTVDIPPLFTTGAGKKVNIPPFVQARSGKKADLPPLFMTGSGKKLDVPPMFTTGSGKKVDVSPMFTTGSGKKMDVPPMFTTGSGKKVDVPRMFTTGSGKKVDVPPMFTTGAGKKVGAPLILAAASGKAVDFPPLFTTESGKKVELTVPLFTTGIGKTVPVQPRTPVSKGNNAQLGSSHGLDKTHLNTPQHVLKFATRIEQVPTESGKGMQSHVVLGQGDSANRKIRERGKSRKGMKTTPFKRPRQLLRTGKRPEQLIEASKRTCRAVPNVAIPRLLKSGRFECRQRHHHEGSQHVPAAQCGSLNFLVQPGCLKRCLDFSFQKSSFGCISCLPAEITTTLHLDSVDEFRVDDCIDWMTSLYPGVSQEPAPCVGSVAWTKLTYGLSVWKLGRLDLTCKWGHRFLTVANVIREFLRRFSIEWHGNRQPHLLRMMRRDSAPASHVVLVIADIEEDAQKRLLLTLSDGWYLARAVLDPILEGRVLRGKLRIGEKIHVAGARLQSTSTRRELFCGDGDELCSSVLRICTNNVRKRKSSTAARLGIQRAPLCSNSLKWVRDDGGQCPATYAVILRSYPLFYMERVDRGHANEQDNALEYVFRREDAEFEARSTHEEIWRQRLPAAAEGKRTKVCGGHGDEIEVQRRSVSSVNEVLICGIADDPLDQSARKLVRIYNSTEDVQANLRGEGQVILFANLWPKKSRWTAKPDGVIIPRRITFSNRYSQYPRSICSIVDLQSGTQVAGMEFDGAFIALHVSSPTDAGDRRFAYFADELRSEICVLALELAGADVNFLPKTLRTTRYGRKFPVIALQNVQYQAISGKHDLVHAKATIRTSFISYQALHRKRAPGILKQVAMKVEGQISGKQAELEVLREAVVSFASGVRGSIGAYFTSTQES